MSSAAKVVANIANAQHSTGPRTEQGKAASSQNATKSGLFSTRDFIRPGEESIYTEFADSLHRELAPVGQLENGLSTEIRRAMWRLRRCGETEADMIDACLAAIEPGAPVPDALQIEATAKLQLAVDRARSQAHRLLHKCTAELRKLQTERFFRREELGPKVDTSSFGLADVRIVRKSMDESVTGLLRRYKADTIDSQNKMEWEIARQMALPPETAKQTQGPARNARCACGSGRKYKHCCALKLVA